MHPVIAPSHCAGCALQPTVVELHNLAPQLNLKGMSAASTRAFTVADAALRRLDDMSPVVSQMEAIVTAKKPTGRTKKKTMRAAYSTCSAAPARYRWVRAVSAHCALAANSP